jgi:hypothetical protein
MLIRLSDYYYQKICSRFHEFSIELIQNILTVILVTNSDKNNAQQHIRYIGFFGIWEIIDFSV